MRFDPHHFLRGIPALALAIAAGTVAPSARSQSAQSESQKQGQDASRKLVRRVEPIYPDVLRQHGIGGTVRLRVIVRPDGTVRKAEILGGNPILADSAVSAVKKWRYVTMDLETPITVIIHFIPPPGS